MSIFLNCIIFSLISIHMTVLAVHLFIYTNIFISCFNYQNILLVNQTFNFFYIFLAKTALNCYHVICCFPLPAMFCMTSWIWSSVRLYFNCCANFFILLKVILSSPSLSTSWKACLLPSSVWGCPCINSKIQLDSSANARILQIQSIVLQENWQHPLNPWR